MTSQTENGVAIPICLPNNCKWDSKKGQYIKTQEERSSLLVVDEGLEKLRGIKGPVCVVSIAGPYRKGKSYVLSKAFTDQQVFPLGHEFDPETMGIWLWIVPEMFQDAKGQEFTVVLLDSEGIDAAAASGRHDNQIFTLTVLLASVLIYNSHGVPTRSDVESLNFIANLSDCIKMQSVTNQETRKSHRDAEYFHKTFPYFVWLLRDVTLYLPKDCSNIKDLFLTRIFNVQDSTAVAQGRQKVAESILTFFSGFGAFALPPPTYNPEVLTSIDDNKSEVNPSFLSGLEEFKTFLRGILIPKNSFNDGELVTGEALAGLVLLYVSAINTSDAIPNVQSAWEQYIETKCSGVISDALNTYEVMMSSQLKDELPCDNDRLRETHENALKKSEAHFMANTVGISTNTTERFLKSLKKSLSVKFNSWQSSNADKTREFCTTLLAKLKEKHLDPLHQRLQGKEGAKLCYNDIMKGYDAVKKDYDKSSKGAKDEINAVFFEFHPTLIKEQEQHMDLLQQLKDYDWRLTQQLEAEAFQQQERQKLEEQQKNLLQENRAIKAEMEMLGKRQEEEIQKLHQQFDNDLRAQEEQVNNMVKANMERAQKEKEKFLQENQELKKQLLAMQKTNEENIKMIEKLSDLVDKQEKEKEETKRAQAQAFKEYQEKLDRMEARHREEQEKFSIAQKTNKESIKTVVAMQEEEKQQLREEMKKAAKQNQELLERMEARHKEENEKLRCEMEAEMEAKVETLTKEYEKATKERLEHIQRLKTELYNVEEKLAEVMAPIFIIRLMKAIKEKFRKILPSAWFSIAWS